LAYRLGSRNSSPEFSYWSRDTHRAAIVSFESLLTTCQRDIDDSYTVISGAQDQLNCSRETLDPAPSAEGAS